MKKLVTFLLVSLTLFANAQSGMLNGSGYAPDFTVTDINSNIHTLYNYLDSGKVVVLEFMSVTCGHCISHAAGTEASYQANGPNGTNVAEFLGLEVNSSTDSADIANFASSYGASFPIANNVSPTAINYQLYYTPGYYVIYPDRSYTTICAAYCVTAQNYSTIEGLLNTAIAAWLPPVYGCTDSLAVNYDPLATVDNDSCDFTSYTIKTLGMSFSPDTIICDVGDTINFILGGGHNAVEVSDSTWIAGGNAPLAGGFSFGYGATGMYIPDDCHTFYYVCSPHAAFGMKGVIIAHHPPVFGCTDSLALNYDSLATVDDGSCTYSSTCTSPSPTGAVTSELTHDRVRITWDNMNSANCMVEQYRIRYREVGTSTWSSKTMAGSGLCVFGLNTTSKKILGLTPSTTYEYYMKAWYCGTATSGWSALQNFTTADECLNVDNFAVSSPTTTKATFTWDLPAAAYSFARIKLRVDTTGSVWQTAGGFGVFYPAITKDKNGLTPGQPYRASVRTWCDPNGGTYRSASWSSFIFWTQPSVIRLEGGTAIDNLDVYPNPSRDIFNVTFTSETLQDLRVRVLNIVGEELINEDLQQFVGEYVKSINLKGYAKGTYFLEIETNHGVINKKLIVQ